MGSNLLHLSKSKFCSAVQCPKMLWLKANKPEEFDDSVMNEQVLETGNAVGDLAMGLFGDYTEVPFDRDLGRMIAETEQLLKAGTAVIAEASFSYEGCFCSVDLLKNYGGNVVELYEVKSSTEVSEIYVYDVAYQYYVLTKLGCDVRKACLVHINSGYVRKGELDLQQLFTAENLTEEAKEKFAFVGRYIEFLRGYMAQTAEPARPELDTIGLKCFDPYDCGFWKYCTRSLPKPNVFDIARLKKGTKFKLYEKGIVSFAEIKQKNAVDSQYMIQIDHALKTQPPAVDKQAVRDFMKQLSYPLYFLDFESFQPAVPLYDDSKPYQQIVFQYSLHFIEAEGGELKHREFLADPGGDPRRGVAEQLCRDIPENVCVTAYNMSFEKGRIRELAQLYPDLREHLLNIHDHIADLMVPFQKRWYYCAAMEGSYSIKYVLPALFPNDPALDYHNLEEVHNGAEASATFAAMQTMTPEELALSRANLLKYCELDTYAMVKVWEKLKGI